MDVTHLDIKLYFYLPTMWSMKHEPNSLDDFHGAPKTVEQAKSWDGSPLIVYGPTGCGKSLLTSLIAGYFGFEYLDLSDEPHEVLVSASESTSVLGGRKLLVVEDVEKYPKVSKLSDLCGKTRNPLIFTTSDFSSKKLNSLKKKCGRLQIRKPRAQTIANYLSVVCERENVSADKEVLRKVAVNSGGDFRAALIDLEKIALGCESISESDLLLLENRDRKSDVYWCLSQVFGGRDIKEISRSTLNIDAMPRDVLFWVDENTPRLYRDPKCLRDSYAHLSRADIFLSRIRRRQYWGFLRYAAPLITGGVNVCRPEKVHYTQYRFPGLWISMSRAKKTNKLELTLAEKLTPHLHVSKTVIRKQYIPLLRRLFEGKMVSEEDLIALDLSSEEIDYLKK
ncbi:MAG: hypothetical protein GF334_02620 [Candidatus Altiarchaeales archaeon]|nr:hypothetical protein [Candidatus Altiarchaeales archaeon]